MEYLKNVLKLSPVGTALVKKDGGFIYANSALSKILGYSHAELVLLSWQQITHPEDVNKDELLVAQMLRGDRESYQLRKRYIRKDGSICPAVLSVSNVLDVNGNFECFLALVNDSVENIEQKELELFQDEVFQAIATDEFVLHYQDIVDLKSLATVGYESLIRWQHPIKGLIYPNDFIERCEQSPDLMLQLCQWVFRRASRDRQKLNGFLSINVSPKSLMHLSFLEMVAEYSQVSDRPVVFLEITERVLANLENTDILSKLEYEGYGLFADDFGQANTGLVQVIQILKSVKHDSTVKIKIDIWFTRNLGDPLTYASMKVLIELFHGMGLEVIAEGIETLEQLKSWQELGCDYGQGWLWGKAKPLL